MHTTAASITAEIRQVNDEFETHFEQGDAAALASLYTRRAMLLPAGMEPVQGTDKIESFWRVGMNMGMKQLKLKTTDVEELADTAIELGTYTVFGAQHQVLDQGKYLVVWKEEQGRWKLHQDIWNSSLPVPVL